METTKKSHLTKAVVTVGDGRGFVIEHGQKRYVVTAAHCLPRNEEGQLLIPAIGGISHLEERTYREFIAPLGAEPSITVEVLFADPVSDIAVVGEPDGQVLWDEADAYNELMEAATPVAIADAPENGPAWLLSLDGNWFPCAVRTGERGPLWLSGAAERIKGGMSGSPIVSADGMAIGIVCTGNGGAMADGPNPRLVDCLPGWLLRPGDVS